MNNANAALKARCANAGCRDKISGHYTSEVEGTYVYSYPRNEHGDSEDMKELPAGIYAESRHVFVRCIQEVRRYGRAVGELRQVWEVR